MSIVINIVFNWTWNTWKSTAINNLAEKLKNKWFNVEVYEEIARKNFNIIKEKWFEEFEKTIYLEEKQRLDNLFKEKINSINVIWKVIEEKQKKWEQKVEEYLQTNILNLLDKKDIKINIIDRMILDTFVYYNFNLIKKDRSEFKPNIEILEAMEYWNFQIVWKLYEFKILFTEPIKNTENKDFEFYNDELIKKLFKNQFEYIKVVSWMNELIEYKNKWILKTDDDIQKISWIFELKNNKEFEWNQEEKLINMIENLKFWDYWIKNN